MRKITAFIVMMSFVFMLQISARPLNAAGNQEQSITGNHQPSVVEEESDSYRPTKKKSILPVILGVVAVGAVVAVLVLVVLKTKYDITGDWNFTVTWEGSAPSNLIFSFKGDKKKGDTYVNNNKFGTYSVDGKDVNITLSLGDLRADYVGKFTSKDSMEGTMSNNIGQSGTWKATRKGSTTDNSAKMSVSDYHQALSSKKIQ